MSFTMRSPFSKVKKVKAKGGGTKKYAYLRLKLLA